MGAWAEYYQNGDIEQAGTPKAYGLLALKTELKSQGYGDDVKLNYQFGKAMKNAVVDFQSDHGLGADGVVGPRTAKELFRKRIYDTETGKNIPDHINFKQVSLESGFDPGAFSDHGALGVDRGLNQINSHYHLDVTDLEAYDPAFSIPWGADYLKDGIDALADVEAGLAAYNVGQFYARKWLQAGKPVSGLYTVGGKDYAQLCSAYVFLVKSQSL